MAWKFEFYGWMILVSVIASLVLSPFLGGLGLLGTLAIFGISGFIYSQWKKKNYKNINFWINALLTFIIWNVAWALLIVGVLVIVLSAIGMGAITIPSIGIG